MPNESIFEQDISVGSLKAVEVDCRSRQSLARPSKIFTWHAGCTPFELIRYEHFGMLPQAGLFVNDLTTNDRRVASHKLSLLTLSLRRTDPGDQAYIEVPRITNSSISSSNDYDLVTLTVSSITVPYIA